MACDCSPRPLLQHDHSRNTEAKESRAPMFATKKSFLTNVYHKWAAYDYGLDLPGMLLGTSYWYRTRPPTGKQLPHYTRPMSEISELYLLRSKAYIDWIKY